MGAVDQPAPGRQGGGDPGLGLVVRNRDVKVHAVALRARDVHPLEPDRLGDIPASRTSSPITASSALVCTDSSTRSGRRSARRCPSASAPAATTAAAATSPAWASERTGMLAHNVPSRYRQPMSRTAAEAAVRESGAPRSGSVMEPQCQGQCARRKRANRLRQCRAEPRSCRSTIPRHRREPTRG